MTLVIPLVDQLSVLLVPAMMIGGLAVNAVIFSLPVTTVTIVVAVFEPFALLAVSLYVVVASGLTFKDPVAELDENPTGLIETAVALLADQMSVVLSPGAIFGALAVNEVIFGIGGAVTATFTVAVTVPELFSALNV